MNASIKSLIALALLGSLSPAMAVTVGSEANCDFSSLNDAINSVPRGGTVSIRLSNNTLHDPFLSIDRNVTIVGGYTNCTDISADANAHSVIRGINNNQPNANITGFANPIAVSVSLVNLRITQGAAPKGAGVRVTAANAVYLSNVEVLNNTAGELGGGIFLDGGDGASVFIQQGSVIGGNIARSRGGGVYCEDANEANQSKLDFRDGSIVGNVAGAHGGGLYLDACDVTGSSAGTRRIADNEVDYVDYPQAVLDQYGIVSGAGIYTTGSSHLTLGGRTSLTVIENNVGRHEVHDGFGFHYEVDRGNGGGIALFEGSLAELVNTHIAENQAGKGAGVEIRGDSRLELSRDPAGCLPHPQYPGCASFTGNQARGYDTGYTGCGATDKNYAGRGGAISMRGGSAQLDGVWVKSNSANQTDGCGVSNHLRYPHGAAFDIREGGAVDLINSVMHDNGHNTADDIVHVDGTNSQFRAFHSTITGNSNVDDGVLRTSGGAPTIGLYNSILLETAALYRNDGANAARLRADCVYASSLATLDDAPVSDLTESVAGSNPGFVDLGGDNFELRPDAAAMDLCWGDELTLRDKLALVDKDLKGRTRPRIVLGDSARSWDAGAFENQTGIVGTIADLGLAIDGGNVVIGLGANMGYQISLTNFGPNPVSNAGFSLSLDTRVQLPMTIVPFGAGWTCGRNGYSASCQYAPSLIEGESAPVVAVQFVAPDEPTVVTSSATVTAPATVVDSLRRNNVEIETTSVAVDSNLTPVFSSVPPSLVTGQSANLGVVLRNNGPDASLGPRLRITFPDSLSNVSVLERPSTGWNCGPLFADGPGRVSMVCATAQTLVGDFGFLLQLQIPNLAQNPSSWLVEARVEQILPDLVGPNLISVNIPVVPGSQPDALFGDSFED